MQKHRATTNRLYKLLQTKEKPRLSAGTIAGCFVESPPCRRISPGTPLVVPMNPAKADPTLDCFGLKACTLSLPQVPGDRNQLCSSRSRGAELCDCCVYSSTDRLQCIAFRDPRTQSSSALGIAWVAKNVTHGIADSLRH